MHEKQPKPILPEGILQPGVAALLLVASLGCMDDDPLPPSTALRSVAEAVEHPGEAHFILTARHVPEHIGEAVFKWPRRSRGTYAEKPTYKWWIVPLVEVEADGTSSGPVMAWVYWREGKDATPEAGLRMLREELDGKRVYLLSLFRAIETQERRTNWGLALRDALERHDLETHPDAPTFYLNSLVPMEPEEP